MVPEKVGVFVSHHHSPEEDKFTTRLVRALRTAGADVWVDADNITSNNFIDKINEGLAGRQWLVLVMTPAALASPWVRDEVNAAIHLMRQGRMQGVVPFVAEPCAEADVPPLWATLHRYDATPSYHTALTGLLRALGLQMPSLPQTSTTPQPPAPAGATAQPQQRLPTSRVVPSLPAPATRPMYKFIYVSYADEDHTFAAKLVRSLNEQLNPKLELAWHYSTRKAYENNRVVGKMRQSEASIKLLDRPIFVVILSPDAIKASYVDEEIKQAQLTDKAIIPVLHGKCVLPGELASTQPVSFLSPRPYEEALAELVARLRAVR